STRRQLKLLLPVYTRHYNEHRPHRALAAKPPGPAGWPDPRIRTRCLSPNRFPISSQALLLGDLPPSVGSRARISDSRAPSNIQPALVRGSDPGLIDVPIRRGGIELVTSRTDRTRR